MSESSLSPCRKLLFVSSIFPDTLHPARGTFNYEMCLALQRAGVEVKIIAPRSWQEVMRTRIAGKAGHATEGMLQHGLKVQYPTYWYPPRLGRRYYGEFYWQSIRKSVNRLLKTWQPDAVLSYWAHPDGLAGVKISEKLGIPSAVIIGGSDVLVLPQNAARKKRVLHVLKHSDAVLTVSQGLASVVENMGVDPARVIPLYQGIDPERFQPYDKLTARQWLGIDHKRPLLVWVGRMVPIKNLDLLIEAASIKARRGDEFDLCLLGDGPERECLQRKIHEFGLEDFVSLVGPVGHEDLPAWYQAADMTVLCSHSEGLPNVLRESLACGTPFVSTNVGSISEIADPQYAELTPPGDVDAFVAAIDQVLVGQHRQLAGQTRARTWDDMAADLLETFSVLPNHQNSWLTEKANHDPVNCARAEQR